MAQELSQAELLDFLCRAGGRVANAALLSHFKGFLRDPRADPGQLQRRRHLFKGFVNSVATVSQDGPGAATYVVLKKRYRDLIGEEEEEQQPGSSPGAPAGRSPPQAPKSPAAAAAAAASRRGTREAGRFPPGEVAAGRRKAGRCPPAAEPGVGSEPSPPASPAVSCLGGERKGSRQPLAQPDAPDPPQSSNGLSLPVGEMGPLPNGGNAQQRIRDWVVAHHAASVPSPAAEGAFPVPAWSQGSTSSSCRPCESLDLGSSSEGWREPPVPVFRSIRSRLSLQDLEDHLEQESSVSEEGSSASRESGSHPRDGEVGMADGGGGGGIRNPAGRQGPGDAPHSNGLKEVVMNTPLVMPLVQDAKPPHHVALLHRIVGRASTMGKAEDRDLLRKTGRPPSPNRDAPLSPRLVPRHKPLANALLAERLAPNPDGSAEHRSSSVPLDGREHTWLVTIAAGSWMQVRALLQEDPHLVLHRDFVSGFTVLHWLAKHGNAQALQDFVTGAQEAGIVLDVNVRSGCGYTPLHLAAIHSHPLVMKILVQRLQCRTQVRDSSGKRAWQYLSANASGEIWQLLGAPRGRTIFPTHPIVRPAATASSSSTSLVRKVSRKPSLANYLKPHHMKRKKGCKCSILQEIEEYSD